MSSIVALDVGGTSIKSGVVALDCLTADGRALDAVTMAASTPTRSTESAEIVLAQLARCGRVGDGRRAG